MKDYTIQTNRLGLRLLEAEDIIYLGELESDPDVKQFFPDGSTDPAKTEDMIKRFICAYEEKDCHAFYYLVLNQMNLLGELVSD